MLKTESYRKGIVYSIFFNVLAKGIGFFNSLAVAYYFGIKGQTDIYFFVLSFITLITGFINGMDLYVVIPEAMRLRVQHDEAASQKFINFFISIYLLLGLLLVTVFFFFPVPLFAGASEIPKEQFEQNIQLLQLGSVLFLLMLLTNLFNSILTSYKFFTMPMVTSMVLSVLSVVMILVFHERFNIVSGMMGITTGYAINLLLLFFIIRKKLNWHFSFNLKWPAATVRRNLLYIQVSNIAPFFRSYLSVRLLTGLGPGSLSAYNYSNQLVVLPENFIIGQFTSVSGIKFSELYAKKDIQGINRIFFESSMMLIFIITPLCFCISLCAEEIISILFERGRFDSASARHVALFLKYAILVVPFQVLINMSSRLFTSFQRIRESFYYNIFINLFISLCLFVGAYFFGTTGFLIALIGGHASAVLALYLLFKKYLPEVNYSSSLIFFIKVLLVNVFVFLALYFLKQNNSIVTWQVIIVFLCFVAYAIFYTLLSTLIKLFSIKKLLSAFKF